MAGARAVEERDVHDDRIELRTSLGSDDSVALERLGSVPDGWMVTFDDVDDSPAETWKRFVRPVEIRSGLVIAPAWSDVDIPSESSVIRIDPGGSFGLGDHPTTRLTAFVADQLVDTGDRVLDVGCGSGVLSIVAARCGASRVVAIDIAEEAREATIENAARNGVGDRIEASVAPLGIVAGTFDVVLANILAPALVSMSTDLSRLTAPHGSLVVSGVLTGGYDHVAGALEPMRVADARHLDGWSAITFVHQER
jgi:ribosomal protein L11 methyltransferase